MHDHDGTHQHPPHSGTDSPPPAPPQQSDPQMEIGPGILNRPAEDQPLLRRNSRGTVAIVDGTLLKRQKGGRYKLDTQPLNEVANFCAGQRFIDQPFGAIATGFLIAPNIVATASHVLPNGVNTLLRVRFVFGFEMNGQDPATTFPASDVYRGISIVEQTRTTNGGDWALVRLDRKVKGRDPLPCRDGGKIGDHDNVYVIGHPFGVPQKIAGDSAINDNSKFDVFFTQLTAFRGNSGSPVFNAQTHDVEGILFGGPLELDDVNGCLIVHECKDGCVGELVTRVRAIPSVRARLKA